MTTKTHQVEPAKCKLLGDFAPTEFKAFLDSFDTVLTDCDGVLWLGDQPLPGAVETINLLRDMGKRVFYVTNNSTKTRDEYVTKVSTLGFKGEKDEIISTAYAAAKYLKDMNYDGKVYVVGSPGISQELDQIGIECTGVGEDPLPPQWNLNMADNILSDFGPEYRCVIVGFDKVFNYLKVAKAASLLARPGSIYIGTNVDANFPYKGAEKIMLPGTAVMVNAVSTASGREPVIMGKPYEHMFDLVREVLPEVDPKRTLMIGDRADTDILLGKNCNLSTLMVGTGVNDLDEIRSWETNPDKRRLVADFYLDKLGDIASMVKKADVKS